MNDKDATVTTQDDSKLAPGDMVSGLESSELVEIQRVAPFGGKTLVEGVGLVGVGRGGSLSTLQTRYCKQSVSLDPSEDDVWIIPPFTPEPAKAPGGEETAGVEVDAGESSVPGGTGSGATTADRSGTATVAKPGAKGTVRRFVVRGNVPVENWGELFRCFVGPAARMNLKKLWLGVQFEMVLPEERP